MGNEVIEIFTSLTTTSIFSTVTMTAVPSNGVVVDYTGEMVMIVIFILLLGIIVILGFLYKRRVYKHKDNKQETRLNNRLRDMM
jgi:uncharacterized membrane protein